MTTLYVMLQRDYQFITAKFLISFDSKTKTIYIAILRGWSSR